MIGWLGGVIRSKRPPVLLLDVAGVGYEVEAPMTTFSDLPQTGSAAELFIHMVVREDAQSLYGFSRESDRDLFRQLLKVNGVGAKRSQVSCCCKRVLNGVAWVEVSCKRSVFSYRCAAIHLHGNVVALAHVDSAKTKVHDIHCHGLCSS